MPGVEAELKGWVNRQWQSPSKQVQCNRGVSFAVFLKFNFGDIIQTCNCIVNVFMLLPSFIPFQSCRTPSSPQIALSYFLVFRQGIGHIWCVFMISSTMSHQETQDSSLYPPALVIFPLYFPYCSLALREIDRGVSIRTEQSTVISYLNFDQLRVSMLTGMFLLPL